MLQQCIYSNIKLEAHIGNKALIKPIRSVKYQPLHRIYLTLE